MLERLSDAQTLQRSLLSEDIALMQQAVETACVGEFDFFRAAWRAWHGSPPDETQLERLFVAYLFRQKVPVFARHFARRLLEAEDDGSLDAAAFGLDGFQPVQRPRFYVNPIENVTSCALFMLCVLPFV